jgi:hypothetical protein
VVGAVWAAVGVAVLIGQRRRFVGGGG